MGYKYDWTNRAYYKRTEHRHSHGTNCKLKSDHACTCWYSPIPSEIHDIGQRCASAVGYKLEPEAVIVNYYGRSSSMGGHQDDVEPYTEAPVVSTSIGAAALFLLGIVVFSSVH